MKLKIKDLEETKIYYEKELKDVDLAGGGKRFIFKGFKTC